MSLAEKFYIDLGTNNTVIYSTKKGFLLREASMVALKYNSKNSSSGLAVGDAAKLMLGKTPQNISVHKPLKQGVIADFDKTAQMLFNFLKKIKQNTVWIKPRLLISLPKEVSRYEKTAVKELGYYLGAGKVQLLDEPLAAALGENLPVLEPLGRMVIDIGAGITEIAVISLGGIVASGALRIGGNDIDEELINYIKSQFQFVIGEQTAERIKIELACALDKTEQSAVVGGIDLRTGLPKKMLITSSDIFPVIDQFSKKLCTLVSDVLSRCPPEIASDISQTGALLTGGGALLKNMEQMLTNEFKFRFSLSKQPLNSVALGGLKSLNDFKWLDRIS